MSARKPVLVVLPLETDLGRDIFRGAQHVFAHQDPPVRWRLLLPRPDYLEIALQKKQEWAGVLVFALTLELEELLVNCGVPVVNVSRRLLEPRLPQVFSDNHQVGRMAAEHLLGRGLVNFVFVPIPEARFSVERYEGFNERLMEAGHKAAICSGEHVELLRVLSQIPRPTGVFCAADNWGVQVLELAEEQGWRVPSELAVLGCDNETLLCGTTSVPLSSIDLNGYGIGSMAAGLLLEAIKGRSLPVAATRVAPAGVVPRGSTDVVASASPPLAAALNVIRSRACEPLSVDALSEAVHVSRRTLERLFRRELRRSVRAEILRVRLDRACQLLRETNRSVGFIAGATGFADYGRFTRVFRLDRGVTPTSYRERFRRV